MMMQTYSSDPPGSTLVLANEEATRRLAADVANMLEPGDFIALSGDLGAGKTTFVRAMITHLANDAAIEVPSPTFTLVQHYDLPRFRVVHADLDRKSTRLNSSHQIISYAVFCLKKKKKRG